MATEDFVINNGVLKKYDGKDEKVIVPQGVTKIGKEAFCYCKSLTEVILPQGLISIGEGAFQGCENLSKIVLPQGVVDIGAEAFMYCDGLKEITLPQSVKAVRSGAFLCCDAKITASGEIVKRLQEEYYDIALEVLGDNPNDMTASQIKDETQKAVSLIGKDFNVDGDKLVRYTGKGGRVVVPYGIKDVGVDAFSDRDDVYVVVLPDTVKKIWNGAFKNCGKLKSINLPEGLTNIKKEAFRYSGVEEITLPQSLAFIGEIAFDGCKNLTSVTIPKNVTKVGDMAFSYCQNLMSIEVEDGNASFTSIGGVLYDKNAQTLLIYPCGRLTSVFKIPQGVTAVNSFAFSNSSGLTGVVLPASLNSLSTVNFGKNLVTIDVVSENKAFSSVNGVLFDKSGKTLLMYPRGKSDEVFVVPQGVTKIGRSAFNDCEGLVEVELPSSVTEVGDWAFGCCGNLKKITAPSSLASELKKDYPKIIIEEI